MQVSTSSRSAVFAAMALLPAAVLALPGGAAQAVSPDPAMGGTVLSATEVPWEITEAVAGLLGLQADRDQVEEGQ